MAHLCPTIGAFSFHCNIWHRILGLGANASRPVRQYGPRTRAGLIRSIFRQSRSAKANLARWACHECPWLLAGASPQRRRPDLDPGSGSAEPHSKECLRERPEAPREVEMLVLREMLIGKDQDRILREGFFDGLEIGRSDLFR